MIGTHKQHQVWKAIAEQIDRGIKRGSIEVALGSCTPSQTTGWRKAAEYKCLNRGVKVVKSIHCGNISSPIQEPVSHQEADSLCAGANEADQGGPAAGRI